MRLVGAIAAIGLVIATLLSINLSIYLDKRNEIHRAIMLYDLLFMQHPTKAEFEIYQREHKLTPVTGEEMTKVHQEGRAFIEDALFRKALQSGDIEIYIYQDHYYYAYKMDTMFYYRSDEPMTPYLLYIAVVASLMFLLLLWLFRFVSSSITPLQELYVQIQRFAEGKKDIHIHVEGDDEVAQVANAFDASVKRTQALQKSRSLFLRNVMHELKTPISKGKLLTHLLEIEPNDKRLLEDFFEQMQRHLEELARVESLTEKNFQLSIKTYALIDIVDHAIDILDANPEALAIDISSEALVQVDFKLFSYAVKNLLDNALKYATQKPITVTFEANCLTISNHGTPFKKAINTYFQAYERDLSQHSLEGLGLGLYIVHEIVVRHGYALKYRFEEGRHWFLVCFGEIE